MLNTHCFLQLNLSYIHFTIITNYYMLKYFHSCTNIHDINNEYVLDVLLCRTYVFDTYRVSMYRLSRVGSMHIAHRSRYIV